MRPEFFVNPCSTENGVKCSEGFCTDSVSSSSLFQSTCMCLLFVYVYCISHIWLIIAGPHSVITNLITDFLPACPFCPFCPVPGGPGSPDCPGGPVGPEGPSLPSDPAVPFSPLEPKPGGPRSPFWPSRPSDPALPG